MSGYNYLIICSFFSLPSFHVGSEANPIVFRDSIKKSLSIFKEASAIGYELSLLDIGGGTSRKNWL